MHTVCENIMKDEARRKRNKPQRLNQKDYLASDPFAFDLYFTFARYKFQIPRKSIKKVSLSLNLTSIFCVQLNKFYHNTRGGLNLK